MQQLNEKALRPDVLKDLVYPIISVDEYTPKLNPDNIVIQFQVLDNFDAAYDLSSFIERSPEDALDTEASETPNVDGRYNVFVEFERNAEFPNKLIMLLKDIENLCPNVEWKLQLYKVNDPIDLDVDQLTKDVRLSTQTEIKEFFDHAVRAEFLNESHIVLHSAFGDKLTYEKVSGLINESELPKYLKNGYELDTTSQLDGVLSRGDYTVLKIEEGYIVGRDGKFLIIN